MQARDFADFKDTLEILEGYAEGGWEEDFVSSLQDRYAVYKGATLISDKQKAIIDRILARCPDA